MAPEITPLRTALLNAVTVLGRSAAESAKDLGRAIRENPPLLGKVLLKALPGVGFAPAAVDTRLAYENWRAFRAWDENRPTKDDAHIETRSTLAAEFLVKGAQAALLTASAFSAAVGANLVHHQHPVAAAPFLAAGAAGQAAALLFLEAEAVPEVAAARRSSRVLLRQAAAGPGRVRD
ncbi:MAG: hypothetical protein PW734_03315 [Verrucomicrobium sp.]|nr:hypothetical protein [Verrucomicrobium sp.]